MNLFNFDFSLVSADGFKLFRKINCLYWKPHYFLVGAVSSSILANTASFPFSEHLLSAKLYLNSHWLTFILDVGSWLCNGVGIFFIVMWIVVWVCARLTASQWNRYGNESYYNPILGFLVTLKISEENPNFWRWKKSLELYLGISCFFSNILIVITPNLDKFGDFIDIHKSLSWSVLFGLHFSIAVLIIVCLEGVKSFLELED